MATLYNDEEEKEGKSENGQMQVATGQTDETGTSVASQQPKQVSSGTQKKGSGMGARLSNLQSYVDANKPATEQLGSSLTGGLTGKGGKVDKFKSDVEKAQEDYDKQKEKAETQATEAQGLADSFTTEGADITSALSNLATDPTKYNQYKEGEFVAPTFDLEGYQNQFSELQDIGSQFETEEGRFEALQNKFADRGEYTQGMQKMDQMLLQGTNTDLNRVGNTVSEAGKILEGQTATDTTYAAAQQSAQEALEGLDFDQYGTQIADRVNTEKQQRERFNELLKGFGGYIDLSEAESIGRPDLAGTVLGGAQSSDLTTDYSSMLNEDDASRLQSLQTLKDQGLIESDFSELGSEANYQDYDTLTSNNLSDLVSRGRKSTQEFRNEIQEYARKAAKEQATYKALADLNEQMGKFKNDSRFNFDELANTRRVLNEDMEKLSSYKDFDYDNAVRDYAINKAMERGFEVDREGFDKQHIIGGDKYEYNTVKDMINSGILSEPMMSDLQEQAYGVTSPIQSLLEQLGSTVGELSSDKFKPAKQGEYGDIEGMMNAQHRMKNLINKINKDTGYNFSDFDEMNTLAKRKVGDK